MMLEALLQRGMTALLSEEMEAHGDVFFKALAEAELLPPDEIVELEAQWRRLIKRRREESGEAGEALVALVAHLRAKIASSVGTG